VVGEQIVSNLQKLILIVALVICSAQLQAAQWRKASDWLGMMVVTGGGDKVGQVEDFAIDLNSGEVNYVVVSVGSFLIKDALIAVAPKALSLESGRLVIAADQVSSARRFGEDSWPAQPDVVADPNSIESVAGSARNAAGDSTSTVQPGTSLPSSGMATISSNSRTATLSADERRIEDVRPTTRINTPAQAHNANSSSSAIARVPNGPIPTFGTLDKNRNGVLNRREIGPWLAQGDSYDAVDLDSSGSVDRFEFDIFSAQRKR
jgi:sporulation protein YlmC with PRC-barrel domain